MTQLTKTFLLALSFFLIGSTGASADPIKPRPVPFQKGMTLADWGANGYNPKTTENRLDQFKKSGVEWVTLLQTWMQSDISSNQVLPGRSTVPDANLLHAIRYARSIGMQVLLRPYVDVEDGAWRGKISASRPADWFRSYEKFALRYARIAQQERVGMLVFASEMRTMSLKYPAQWSSLAERVRKAYSGPVSYEANWDEAVQAKWLDRLDAIGVSAYNPICSKPTTDVKTLSQGWGKWIREMGGLSSKLRRPVLFTEIGYRPLMKTCLQPWNTSWEGALAPEAQTNAYAASLASWWPVSWFRGTHWWAQIPAGIRPSPENHDPLQGAWGQIQKWYAKRAAGQIGTPVAVVRQTAGTTDWNLNKTPVWEHVVAGILLCMVLLGTWKWQRRKTKIA